MGMDVGGSKGGVMCKPNIVPMIDILLVLLIIFMVITPLTPKGLEALIPQPPPPGQQQVTSDVRTVVIVIKADHSMMINNDPVTVDTLGDRLFDIFKTRAERVVFVQAAPELEFQAVAQAIDIAKGAAIDKVGLMTEQVQSAQ